MSALNCTVALNDCRALHKLVVGSDACQRRRGLATAAARRVAGVTTETLPAKLGPLWSFKSGDQEIVRCHCSGTRFVGQTMATFTRDWRRAKTLVFKTGGRWSRRRWCWKAKSVGSADKPYCLAANAGIQVWKYVTGEKTLARRIASLPKATRRGSSSAATITNRTV